MYAELVVVSRCDNDAPPTHAASILSRLVNRPVHYTRLKMMMMKMMMILSSVVVVVILVVVVVVV